MFQQEHNPFDKSDEGLEATTEPEKLEISESAQPKPLVDLAILESGELEPRDFKYLTPDQLKQLETEARAMTKEQLLELDAVMQIGLTLKGVGGALAPVANLVSMIGVELYSDPERSDILSSWYADSYDHSQQKLAAGFASGKYVKRGYGDEA
jgi:hypothetical protein